MGWPFDEPLVAGYFHSRSPDFAPWREIVPRAFRAPIPWGLSRGSQLLTHLQKQCSKRKQR